MDWRDSTRGATPTRSDDTPTPPDTVASALHARTGTGTGTGAGPAAGDEASSGAVPAPVLDPQDPPERRSGLLGVLGLLAGAGAAWGLAPGHPATWGITAGAGVYAAALAVARYRAAPPVDLLDDALEPLEAVEVLLGPDGPQELPTAARVAALAAQRVEEGAARAVVVARSPERVPLRASRAVLAPSLADAPVVVEAWSWCGDGSLVLLVVPRDLELLGPALARHLELALRRAPGRGGHTVRLGAAIAPLDGEEAGEVLACAVEASRQGRSGITWHAPAALAVLAEQDDLRREVRRAIADSEIVVHYQPVVDPRDLAILGAEALVRWGHPQHGLMTPDRFLPLVHDQGVMLDLTRRVLGKACRCVVQWRPRVHPAFTITVNVSGAQLRDQWLPRLVAHLVQRYRVPPDALWLEAALDDVRARDPRVLRTLERLAAAGVRLSLDGVESAEDVALLGGLWLHAVQVDVGATGDASLATLRAVTAAAREVSLEVHVKRVECPEQLAAVRDVPGVTRIQGFALAPPVQRSTFGLLASEPGPFAALGTRGI